MKTTKRVTENLETNEQHARDETNLPDDAYRVFHRHQASQDIKQGLLIFKTVFYKRRTLLSCSAQPKPNVAITACSNRELISSERITRK